MAILVLSSCINVTYKLTVNSDATLSGTLKAEISKQVMSTLGVTSQDQLSESLTSGDMDLGVDAEVAKSCVESEDASNYIITCTIENMPAADVNDTWSLTKSGNELTFRVVNEVEGDNGDENLMPEIDLGNISFSATFPGEITSITGKGATQTGPKTVEANSSLSDPLDFTVVASSEGSTSIMGLLVLVVIGLAALALLVIAIVLLRKGKKNEEPAETATGETATDVPPTADSSDPSI
jgi:hypothetical protein